MGQLLIKCILSEACRTLLTDFRTFRDASQLNSSSTAGTVANKQAVMEVLEKVSILNNALMPYGAHMKAIARQRSLQRLPVVGRN